MVGSHHLRKSLRFRAVGLVTSRAEHPGIQFRRLNAGVVGVIGQCAMACFAGDYDVFALAFLLGDIGMAGLAGLVAGVNDWFGSDLRNGSATEVPVLAKRAGNDSCAQNHKAHENGEHDCCESDEVFYVLEQASLPGNAIRVTLPISCTSHQAEAR